MAETRCEEKRAADRQSTLIANTVAQFGAEFGFSLSPRRQKSLARRVAKLVARYPHLFHEVRK